MTDAMDELLTTIHQCRICADELPLGPRPVVQAPGRKVHESGIPWDDPSGDRLREWLGISTSDFYDPAKIAIVPMGFCYPGKAKSGDKPPRRECAPMWHSALEAHMPCVELTLLIGQYAVARYLGSRRKPALTATIQGWEEYRASGFVPLPHPSGRNQPWRQRNPWFERDMLPHVRDIISKLRL